MAQADALSLMELNTRIKEVINAGMERSYWVIGEISEIKVNYSGHCYLELVQKDEESDQIVARSRATIWAQTFRLIKPYFETTTGQVLVSGLGILVKVSVEFHELFGLSLNILDIEPTYTVGELAVRKQKIIDRLKQEGVIDMNRELELPTLCRKIAVISSETAAGYGDFIDQLHQNTYGYKFYNKLFSAVMQGEEAEKSIIDALDRIYHFADFFDAVVIIRGGGSQADLSCFNSYWLAYHITQFPLPVLTGIGHEQDDSVTDIVAHTRLKTPTAVAEFLIDTMARTEEFLNEVSEQIVSEAGLFLESRNDELLVTIKDIQISIKDFQNTNRSELVRYNTILIDRSRRILHNQQLNLQRSEVKAEVMANKKLTDGIQLMEMYLHTLKRELRYKLGKAGQKLDAAGESIRLQNPQNILKKGYSITLKDNKSLSDVDSLNEGDTIETFLHKGKIRSSIKKLIS